MQEEKGAEGTPHLQGVISFPNGRRFESVKKLLGRAHLEKVKNLFASRRYCSDKRKRFGKIWDFRKTKTQPQPEGNEFPEWRRQSLIVVPFTWQKKVLDICSSEPDRRTIYWFWESEGGAGKTELTHLIRNKWPDRSLAVSGSAKDIKCAIALMKKAGHSPPKIVIWDIPRSKGNKISYASVEKIKDGRFFSGKYESMEVAFPPCHIICFANEPPLYDLMSKDRWKVAELKNVKNKGAPDGAE